MADDRHSAPGGVEWMGQRVPPWFLMTLAILGAPSSAGLAIWNQNAELKMQRIEDHLAFIDRRYHEDVITLKATVAELHAELDNRVRLTQRVEMMTEYERRFRMIESKLDRLDIRLFNGAGLSYQGQPLAPRDRRYDFESSTDPREGYGDPDVP